MSGSENKAVFLSYASQDAAAARCICEALRAAGVEVWFDQSELVGGDAWDAKIRGQIASCALFVPVISAATQARREGYFRLEWRVAVERMRHMDDDLPFLVPVVIGETKDAEAFVPEKFREVQWTRLPEGETPPAFCERVKKLMGGVVGPRTSPAALETRRPRVAATPGKSRRWFVPTIIGVAAIVAFVVWLPGRKSAQGEAAASRAPHSEVRRLALRADGMFEQRQNGSREDLVVAEQLCKQAIALDANDAHVWAVYSRVCVNQIAQGYDRSKERYALAGTAADRAVRLTPELPEARYALANFYRIQIDRKTRDEGIRVLRELVAASPGNKLFLRTLGNALRGSYVMGANENRYEEALTFYERAHALPGGDPLSLHNRAAVLGLLGRLDEAERSIDEALALQPNGATYLQKIVLILMVRGDVTQARDTLTKVPVAWLREDRGAYLAAWVALCSGDTARCLQVLQGIPRDYLEDNYFAGPKAFLTGQAHQMAGGTEAARADWRSAQQLIEQRLSTDTSSVALLNWKARLLANLGERSEGERALRLAEQLAGGTPGTPTALTALTYLDLGKHDELLRWLPEELDKGGWTTTLALTRALLPIDHRWKALREHDQFKGVLAAAAQRSVSLQIPGAARQSVAEKSIAVLAFRQHSADPENEYLCEAISDELCNVLGRVPGLRVAASASAFSFKGSKRERPVEMARKLGVAYLVDGSVQKIGNRVRVRAELIKAADESSVWKSDLPDYEVKDMFAVQDEVVGAIAKNLQLQLGNTLRPAKPVNPEAFALYLAGRQHWNQRNEPAFVQAEAAFARAVQLDPHFALGYAGLADVWLLRGNWRVEGKESGEEMFAKSEAFARRALALEPGRPDAYATLGNLQMFRGHDAEARASFEQALAINDSYATAHHWYGLVLARSGRIDLAAPRLLRAAELDPLSPIIVESTIRMCWGAGRLDEVEQFGRRRQLLVTNANTETLSPVLGLVWRAQQQSGREAEALASIRAALAAGITQLDVLGDALVALAHAGETTEVEKRLPVLLRLPAPLQFNAAPVLAAMGRRDEAMASAAGTPAFGPLREKLLFDPVWDSLRDEPRFLELFVKIGRVKEYEVARETVARLRRQTGTNK